MKILSRYILREQIPPFFTGFLFFTFILLLNQFFLLAELIITKNVEVVLVLKLFLLMLPGIISLTIPMAVLISVVVSMGRLSSDSEIIALRASGLSTYFVYKPVIISSIVVLAGLMIFNDTLLVYSHKNYNKVFIQILRSNPTAVLEDGIFSTIEDRTLWVEKIDKKKKRLNNIIVYSKNEAGGWDVIKANWGKWKRNKDGSKILLLFKGRLFKSEIDKDSFSIVDFSNGSAEILLSDSRIDYSEKKGEMNPIEMNSLELYDKINSSSKSYKEDRDVARYWVELLKKHAIPFSCLVFSIVGAPLGLFPKRSGKGLAFGISIVVFFVYYILFMTGQSYAIRGVIHPVIGVWSANIILLLAGFFLIIYREIF